MIDFSIVSENMDFLMKGLRVTLSLSVLSIVLSLILGTFLGVLRHSKFYPFNYIATAYIEITRSIPLILYIIFIYFTASPFLSNNEVFSCIFGFSSLEFQTACIALVLFEAAYVAEIVRGGLSSIEKELVDAAKSLGLNYFQRLRYIILPVVLKRMSPALVSQFVSLTKDTSLASAIGLIELTRAGEIIYERTQKELEVLIFISLIYFVICFSISMVAKRLSERSFSY
ncbi:MAG: amino acid ABC transporter permease [Candidatus Gastranaerophilaceae bacterium]|jgi:His/Glu/Gln/Arg/opine family amino acid ABC transporter permease subunit